MESILARCCLLLSIGAFANEAIIEPPPSPSSDVRTFGRQFVFHNADRLFERYKEYDKGFKKNVETIEKQANIAPEPVEADNFKLTSGLLLDKGLVYSEIFWYSPVLRSEVNLIKQNSTLILKEGIVSTIYSKPFEGPFNFNIAITTTFE